MFRPGKRRRPQWTATTAVLAATILGSVSSTCGAFRVTGTRSKHDHHRHVGVPPNTKTRSTQCPNTPLWLPFPALAGVGMSRGRHPTDSMGGPRSRRGFLLEGALMASTAGVTGGGDSNMPASIDSAPTAVGGVAQSNLPENDEGQVVEEELTSGGRHNGGGDPDVFNLVDLVELLSSSEDPVWELVRFEGREASKQSHISSMIQGSVLARTSLEDAVSCDVANKMATTFLSATEVNSLVCDMFANDRSLGYIVADDLLAHAMQDSSLPDVLTALLFHKGFTALTTYRLMHWLWRGDRQNLARYLQSICSEVCAADIHPSSVIGKGIFMAGGCDIVIGETAVVGDSVCLLQGVTLGGTGKETGDRHPKVGKGCHIGAGSSVLGNILVGEGSRIEAASVVVKPIPPYSVNRGVPCKTVDFVVCDPFQEDVRGAGGHGVGFNGVERREEGSGEAGTGGEEQEEGEAEPRMVFPEYGSLYIGI